MTNGGQRALCLSGWTPEDDKQLLGSDGTRQVKPVKWMRLCNGDIRVVKVQNFLSLKLISSALWPLPECAINDWFYRTLVLQPLVSAGSARRWWRQMNQGGNKTKSMSLKVLEFSKDPPPWKVCPTFNLREQGSAATTQLISLLKNTRWPKYLRLLTITNSWLLSESFSFQPLLTGCWTKQLAVSELAFLFYKGMK